jgi:hypothetical protein
VGPVTLSASRIDRPLGAALLILLLLGVTSPAFGRIWRRRSTFSFYVTAAVMSWIFSLGPRPHFMGHTVMYRGPYALLMLLPGYGDRLRVPARFEMITLLAVATAAGLALVRLTALAPRSWRLAITSAVLFAIAADGWTFTCPIAGVPAAMPLPDSIPHSAAVLQLPLGRTDQDIAAIYQSIGHGRHVVNGYSGYDPSYYRALRFGLEAREDPVLTWLARFAPLAVVVPDADDPSGEWVRFVQGHAGAVRVTDTGKRSVFLLERGGPEASAGLRTLPIRSMTSNVGTADLRAVTDGNLRTAWVTPGPQRGGEAVVIDLGELVPVSGVTLQTGTVIENLPRRVNVSTSEDEALWHDAWTGTIAVPALRGLLVARDGRFVIDFPPAAARYVRLVQLDVSPLPWTVAEISVRGPDR